MPEVCRMWWRLAALGERLPPERDTIVVETVL
jgi:hypothetical protein